MRTRFFYPTGAEIDQGFFDMCLKGWPLKADDLVAGSEIEHPDVVTVELTGYLRLIDDSGIPAQVATEVNIDRRDTGLRAYTMRTLIFGHTMEMSIGGDIIDPEYPVGVASGMQASIIAMAIKVGVLGITRIMNACVLPASVSLRLAREIEDSYPVHARVGYDFLTEWDLQTHKRGLELLVKQQIGARTIDDALYQIDGLCHAWELAEFEAEAEKLGELYFRRAGRWTGRMNLTPGSPGRARAECFVAQYGANHASQGVAIQG